jgi:hypothetical protein
MLRYSFLRKFDLWVKYGGFYYANKKAISSGSEMILDNKKQDITVQLRMSF